MAGITDLHQNRPINLFRTPAESSTLIRLDEGPLSGVGNDISLFSYKCEELYKWK